MSCHQNLPQILHLESQKERCKTLPAAEFIIEMFGNARSLFNPNASWLGKYTELQFTERESLLFPSGEHNFHIFYYLIAGLSPERSAGARPNAVRANNAHRFKQLKVALKTVSLSKRHAVQACQVVAAILHLGNLEFTIDHLRDVNAAVVRNVNTLALC
ncbi:P-loop containing nucleoside triphosphate hydrolase protein [Pisolithus microcarpus]|nr:P-loop containing nucleoside triphosphate hydrolase protein [Pisolithus microcarpus]